MTSKRGARRWETNKEKQHKSIRLARVVDTGIARTKFEQRVSHSHRLLKSTIYSYDLLVLLYLHLYLLGAVRLQLAVLCRAVVFLALLANTSWAQVRPPGEASGDSSNGEGFAQTSCLTLLRLEGGCAYDLSLDDAALAPGTNVSDVCSEACVAGGARPETGAGFFRTNCLVLLKLEGGCAYDLSRDDSALVYGTRVSDVCPNECSGHAGCVASAVDIAFLGATNDASGFGAPVELHGDVCVDWVGAKFDGEGWVAIAPGQDYDNGAEFSITFWLVVGVEGVWSPHSETGPRALYTHTAQSESSAVGSIVLSISRGEWLDAYRLHASIAGTETIFTLNLLSDARPKWTHFSLVVDANEYRVYEDGEPVHTSAGPDFASRTFVGTMDLASEVFLGGFEGAPGFRGSVAMLQLYPTALDAGSIACVYFSGRQLVQNGRMAQATPSACQSTVTTGCTNPVASNFDPLSTYTIDDGSCEYAAHAESWISNEHGIVHVTDSWQRIQLQGRYAHPVVLVGVITRQSTTQAIVRLRNIAMDAAGVWSFEIRVEKKSCHFAMPPPSREQASFLVLEAGVSAEGFQAGIKRVHDVEWHRVSFLPEIAGRPVVVSQVQTYDNRTTFVSSRHQMGVNGSSNASGVRHLAFFLQVQGEGVWCQDGEFFAEYFDSLELSGNALATQCELDVPNWQWHASSAGVPPPMLGKIRSLPSPMLFSARWTTRLGVADSDEYLFSSLANKGSRIVVDGVTVLDYWEECCSTFTTESVPLSAGYHTVAYEYRSGYTADYSPIDSYANQRASAAARDLGRKCNNCDRVRNLRYCVCGVRTERWLDRDCAGRW